MSNKMRKWTRFLIAVITLLAGEHIFAVDQIVQVWAPCEVVVGRTFRIVLDVPADGGDLQVSYPACVYMFDRTGKREGTAEQRFYFRALKPGGDIAIRFTVPKGYQTTVDLKVITPQENLRPRRYGALQLPRVWPLDEPDYPERKSGVTMHTPRQMAVVRGPDQGRLDEQAENCARRSNDYLWDMLPPSEIPRWHWVNLSMGCPIHGKEVFRDSGFGGFGTELDGKPWKAYCVVGKEWYPSNNIAAGDMTSGPFPDDGYGFLYQDHKYTPVAVYCQGRASAAHSALNALYQGYLKTGNRRYAHKLGLLMTRLAEEYAFLAGQPVYRFKPQSDSATDFWLKGDFSKRRRGPQIPTTQKDLSGGGFSNYSIALAGQCVAYAQAYDLLWEYLDTDKELPAYAKSKGIPVETTDDLKKYIEYYVLRVSAQACLDNAAATNPPGQQLAMMQLALCLNYPRCRELLEWTYTGGGQIGYFLTNWYFKDGSAFESTGHYNGIHVGELFPIEEILERLRKLRPTVYTREAFPPLARDGRYQALFEWPVDTVCIDRYYPKLGDEGPTPNNKIADPICFSSVRDFKRAYEYAWRTFQKPRFAQVLWAGKGYEPSSDGGVTHEEIEQVIRKQGGKIERPSMLHDGYGIAYLRSERPPASMADLAGQWEPRTFWMYYSRTRGHRHDDIFDLGLMAHKLDPMVHMGYPYGWAQGEAWDNNWAVHYCARILSDYDQRLYKGSAITFKVLDGLGVISADGDAFRVQEEGNKRYIRMPEEMTRRTSALIDVTAKDSYVVDFFRLRGGREHGWSFHGNPHAAFTTTGLDLARQEGGTAAGPQVGYGEMEKLNSVKGLGALAYFYNVERARPAGPWSADWTLKDTQDVHLQVNMLSPSDAAVIIGDGKHPQAPEGAGPYKLRWVVVRRAGPAPLATQFVSVFHVYQNRSSIEKTELLSDPRETTFAALRVDTAGRCDWICGEEPADNPGTAPQNMPERKIASAGIEFTGQFGVYTEQSGKMVSVSLVRGKKLLKDSFGIAEAGDECRGKIVALDRQARTITIEPCPPCPAAMVGQYIHVGDDVRRGAYQVIAVKQAGPARCTLTLNWPSLIGEGTAQQFEDGVIHAPQEFPLGTEADYQRYYRYYYQARLTNAEENVDFLVDNIDWHLPIILSAESGADISAERLKKAIGENGKFRIYDYGLGDAVCFPCAVQLQAAGDSRYRLDTDGGVTLHLPIAPGRGASKVSYQTPGQGAEKPLDFRRESGRIIVTLAADQLGAGRGIQIAIR